MDQDTQKAALQGRRTQQGDGCHQRRWYQSAVAFVPQIVRKTRASGRLWRYLFWRDCEACCRKFTGSLFSAITIRMINMK